MRRLIIFLSFCSTQIKEHTEVIVENVNKPKSSTASAAEDNVPKVVSDQPPVGHRDMITDVILMNRPQQLIITAGYDGTLKMWK